MNSEQQVLLRIRLEFIEMPDLKLSRVQAGRLLNLPQATCDAALSLLVRTGFLWRTPNDQFVRRGLGRVIRADEPRSIPSAPSV